MTPDPTQSPAIEMENVGILRGERWLLQGVNWSVPAGSAAAILGPNGSGKSTLSRILCGYLFPTRGRVAINGHTMGQTDLNALRQSIRLVQPTGPYDVDPQLTARQVVLSGLRGTLALYHEFSDADQTHADELLERVGLKRFADRTYATLSTGERLRSLIARALLVRPKLLLLDEPTAGLDLLAREQVLAAVQSVLEHAPGVRPTVVMVTHHVEELPAGTSNVLLLDNGQVAASGTPEVVLRDDVLSKVYQCPVTVLEHGGRRHLSVKPGAWRDILER